MLPQVPERRSVVLPWPFAGTGEERHTADGENDAARAESEGFFSQHKTGGDGGVMHKNVCF